ncbi:FAD-NAD(P)-binding protein [Enterobacteriaceae bacterium H20N1]|uniref:FAD-NAD(P)-binding protein n=1 Tax=Dryocola boscaweniae TaxID=2925397 RepID=A0A9X2W977_9ENTR|nr:FAD-NAD(P)-binding protein [Dryocola boscaweniae]MCT4701594.1 FAD-NAD(P)-binding protein [Dryocola boscaweniae]MCT4718763.1 FAD-NAD(P)-binding protein [Dryocola boscaweniae]
MKKIAIIGTGPTGIYTFYSLLKHNEPLSISLFEQAHEAGVGMPYSFEDNSRMMLANIASIEIPAIFSTYLDWLRSLSEEHLARYGVQPPSLHDRQFLPRILLGEYFRDQFLQLVAQAKKQGFEVEVHESCQVTDLETTSEGVRLWAQRQPAAELFDLAVIATGHVWPDEDPSVRTFFPSPWSGLMEAKIGACKVGIMGTSLSGIDAAMAVVVQHGTFIEKDGEPSYFKLDEGSEALNIVLMSRSGILPEADFYCPIPYEPLSIVTDDVVKAEIAAGTEGLLDRIFRLVAKELERADPLWSERIALSAQNADSFSDAYFADRKNNDSFHWAESNLLEVERNKRDKHTVPWRYTVLRLHEVVQEIVPHLDERDGKRFDAGLARVFIDNYAAIPSQSIRRLLALREAGIISILTLGQDYKMDVKEEQTVISVQQNTYEFDVFIDARGQKPLKTKDLPFPTLRKQLELTGDDIPDVGDDYTLLEPASARGRIAFGALPYLMHDQPFVQGITVCAEIGAAMARAIFQSESHPRRRLPVIDI